MFLDVKLQSAFADSCQRKEFQVVNKGV